MLRRACVRELQCSSGLYGWCVEGKERLGCLSDEGRAGLGRAGSARAAGHGVVASRGEGRGCGELVERQEGADWGEPVGTRRFWPEGATHGEARWRRHTARP